MRAQQSSHPSRLVQAFHGAAREDAEQWSSCLFALPVTSAHRLCHDHPTMGLRLPYSALSAAIFGTSTIAIAAPSLPLSRDWALTIHGDFRPRLEVWRQEDSAVATRHWEAAVTQRARLGADISHRDGVHFVMMLQDIRTWGGDRSLEAPMVEAHTANAVIPLDDHLQLVVGRQDLDIGHARILDAEDFRQRSRSFDAVRLTFTATPEQLVVFYAKARDQAVAPSSSAPQAGKGAHDVGGIGSRTALIGNHTGSLLFLADRHAGDEMTRFTLGGHVDGLSGPFRYRVEAYGQSGSEQHETVGAYLGSIRAEVASQRRFAPRLAIWAEYASGDGTRQRSFEAPFGNQHEYFGSLDLFAQLPETTRFGGLTDFGAGLGARPLAPLELNLDWHHFSTGQGEPSSRASGILGQEFDMSAHFELGSIVELDALAAMLIPTRQFSALSGRESLPAPDVEFGGYLSVRTRF